MADGHRDAPQSVIVHAHCYQPPREDPWREAIDVEPSAAPDHDWNARIDRESYARLGHAPVREPTAHDDPDARRALLRFVNAYAWCSFDVGATLCEWLAAEAPSTIAAMQAGDAASVRRLGHGNAIAAPYHHVILPLASPRDRQTEVRWGIADFRRRFGREPEGMWLPECAVDDDTLDVLAREGIRFTILAPYQVRGADGSGMPVRWRGSQGRELAILPYDGNLAGEVAFGDLLRDPEALARRLVPSASPGTPRCTTLATDGETFGHHHRGGDGALAEALVRVARHTPAQITNAAALVAAFPPTRDVTLVSPSAWSCAHGVERWRSNCGCRLDGNTPPAQQWRGPLREALTALARQCGDAFERDGRALFAMDPWTVRDAYGEVVALDGEALGTFARRHAIAGATDAQIGRARALLELQRASLRTFTSCAWFFDDVDRIETRQVLRYAARAIELSDDATQLQPPFVAALSAAVGGGTNRESAADVFLRDALPRHDVRWGIAAGAIACATRHHMLPRIGTFDITLRAHDGAWDVTIAHRRTGEQNTFVGAVQAARGAMCVRLTSRASDHDISRDVTMREFPESVAMLLLADGGLDDLHRDS